MHRVQEGDPSLVRRVEIVVVGDTGNDDIQAVRASLVDISKGVVGEPFRMQGVEAAESAITRRLQNRGHARASVEHVVDAYP